MKKIVFVFCLISITIAMIVLFNSPFHRNLDCNQLINADVGITESFYSPKTKTCLIVKRRIENNEDGIKHTLEMYDPLNSEGEMIFTYRSIPNTVEFYEKEFDNVREEYKK